MKCWKCGNELTTGDAPNSAQCRQCEQASISSSPASAGSAPRLLERWANDCGLDIVYNGIRLGYERHMARDLHRELAAQLAEWDAQNAEAHASATKEPIA